jgi:YggT family protein
MIGPLITLVGIVTTVLSLLVIVHVILSFFVSPYHPVRIFLSRVVEPMLSPIRRLLPAMQGIDLSPFILILLIQLLEIVLVGLLRSFT